VAHDDGTRQLDERSDRRCTPATATRWSRSWQS